MLLKHLPSDSFLHLWCKAHNNTEVPIQFLLSIGASCLGALLQREVWISHLKNHPIYPNQPVMLIGPTGCGKDTCINFGVDYLQALGFEEYFIGGRTIEALYNQLQKSDPAIGYLPAGEMTSFLGGKDYQQGLVQGLTDLMSNNPTVNISLKSKPGAKIHNPTLTVHMGSTVEWLHKAMPEGSLEGGFVGRFLVAITTGFAKVMKPLPAYEYTDVNEMRERMEALKQFYELSANAIRKTKGQGEVIILYDARDEYNNWYYNRFSYFAKSVQPYANRARDTVLRLALISAISRLHYWYIDEYDIRFGAAVLQDTAKAIEGVLLPPTREAQCAAEIKELLPASWDEIVRTIRRKWDARVYLGARDSLIAGKEIVRDGDIWRQNDTSSNPQT